MNRISNLWSRTVSDILNDLLLSDIALPVPKLSSKLDLLLVLGMANQILYIDSSLFKLRLTELPPGPNTSSSRIYANIPNSIPNMWFQSYFNQVPDVK